MILLILLALLWTHEASAALAGGRPNSISGGQNAFAGVVNPANPVWIDDRFDVGGYAFHQKSSLTNHDNNPLFLPGKANTSYKRNYFYDWDVAFHKKFNLGNEAFPPEFSLTLALYSSPTVLKVRTQEPVPISGTTPVLRSASTRVLSTILSVKLNEAHSVGLSVDYFRLHHERGGNQHADNALRSVSPGHVTNNGTDHAEGVGMSLGWRWKIHQRVDFGAAWGKKASCGQFRRYRGFEPHHARNYISQTLGAGFGFIFNERLRGRIEALWLDTGNLPGSNSAILPNGKLNPSKRGSNRSPGPGMRDTTLINLGMGYRCSHNFSLGVGYSHRLKPSRRSSNILTHTYLFQTVFDLVTVGANIIYKKNDLFFGYTQAFRNKVSGYMPPQLGGGRFTAQKINSVFTFSWGYRY